MAAKKTTKKATRKAQAKKSTDDEDKKKGKAVLPPELLPSEGIETDLITGERTKKK